jgi:hypothetical protein
LSRNTEFVHVLGAAELTALRACADELIPAAHGMPAAGAIVDSRVGFVLAARPDLVAPLRTALRPELGGDPLERLGRLGAEPDQLAALQLTIVAGYYTDTDVRRRIGYPGQVAKPVDAYAFPDYVAEGLLDPVIERGPIWRDPAAPIADGRDPG